MQGVQGAGARGGRGRAGARGWPGAGRCLDAPCRPCHALDGREGWIFFIIFVLCSYFVLCCLFVCSCVCVGGPVWRDLVSGVWGVVGVVGGGG